MGNVKPLGPEGKLPIKKTEWLLVSSKMRESVENFKLGKMDQRDFKQSYSGVVDS